MLSELQKFLTEHQRVSLADLEIHFRMDGAPLQEMLNRLIRKGRVRKMEDGKKCGGCHSCADSTMEFYEWVKSKPFR
jgi:putative ferrous iron transport protein C